MGGVRSEIEEIVDREGLGYRGRGPPAHRVPPGHGLALAEDRKITRPDGLGPRLGQVRPREVGRGWQELFDTHELVRNEREIRKI
jgi:hypothetical protein